MRAKIRRLTPGQIADRGYGPNMNAACQEGERRFAAGVAKRAAVRPMRQFHSRWKAKYRLALRVDLNRRVRGQAPPRECCAIREAITGKWRRGYGQAAREERRKYRRPRPDVRPPA